MIRPSVTQLVPKRKDLCFLALRDSWGDQALALPKRSNTRSRKFLKLNIP